MGKKLFCFFQTAETWNRAPDSGVKGSGANHYPRAPALLKYKSIGTRICSYDYVSVFINVRKCICLCISKDLYSHPKINYYCNTLPVAMSQLRVCLSRLILLLSTLLGGGPRVVVNTAAFHARVRDSIPGLGGLKETKNVSSPSTCESQYCGLEFRILCLEGSVISIISPSSGCSPGPV